MPVTDPFPREFLWGAATSAYQIEGSPLADGAGPSIWHQFCHTPGRVANGDTGDVACDHYRRMPDDIALLSALGLKAYRFSIAWGRVFPDGTGRVNHKGLDFYRRLVDALLERGIAPMATLYHWDLPLALDDRGGWLNPDSALWFADYAATLFDALDDRVRLWVTLNEPWVVVAGGYLQGDMAPGHRDLSEGPIAAHNLLRAHGAAVAAYRAMGRHQIGLTVNLEPQHPASDDPLDLEAANRRDVFINRWFLDPVFLGRYPDELAEIFGAAWPRVSDAGMAGIRAPVDFLGVNYYSRARVRDDPADRPARAARVRQDARPHTAMDWEIYPEGLTETLLRVSEDYAHPPLYITENGAAFDDPPVRDGEVRDTPRVEYFRAHLMAAHRALEQGADLRGYFAWSLLDNFEWAFGYSKRFGLVHVDYATQRRTPKASARFYREVIESRGASLFRDAE